MLYIGSHVSVGGKDMLLGAVKEALSYNANSFMFYTGAPQNTVRKDITQFKSKEAHELMDLNNIKSDKCLVHAPYIINLANMDKKETFEIANEFLIKEINRVEALGFKYLVLHPGSHVGGSREQGIIQVGNALNKIINDDKSNVVILIETMAGKGREIGINFDEIATIFSLIDRKDKIGVCMDTCHLNDAGYDLTNFDKILDEFDEKIGLSYLKAIHMNDSKNTLGAHKDRHENYGFGTIGFETLQKIMFNPRVDDLIKILETPYINDKAPYKDEIIMIRNNVFNPNLKD